MATGYPHSALAFYYLMLFYHLVGIGRMAAPQVRQRLATAVPGGEGLMAVSTGARIQQIVVLGGLLAFLLALYFPYWWFGVYAVPSDQEFSEAQMAAPARRQGGARFLRRSRCRRSAWKSWPRRNRISPGAASATRWTPRGTTGSGRTCTAFSASRRRLWTISPIRMPLSSCARTGLIWTPENMARVHRRRRMGIRAGQPDALPAHDRLRNERPARREHHRVPAAHDSAWGPVGRDDSEPRCRRIDKLPEQKKSPAGPCEPAGLLCGVASAAVSSVRRGDTCGRPAAGTEC